MIYLSIHIAILRHFNVPRFFHSMLQSTIQCQCHQQTNHQNIHSLSVVVKISILFLFVVNKITFFKRTDNRIIRKTLHLDHNKSAITIAGWILICLSGISSMLMLRHSSHFKSNKVKRCNISKNHFVFF